MHLHDARIVAAQPHVAARVRELASLAGGERFDALLESTMRATFAKFLRSIGAHEGTVWLLDEDRTVLIPRFNNGPKAAEFVGHFRQSLRAGMISMVVSTEQPICENDVARNERRDGTLDRQLSLQTCAMLAVPFYFAGELRGVLSAVQLKAADSPAPEPPGFTPQHLESLQLAATVLSRLIDQRLYCAALGLEGLA
jgi:transcriptional regulator with GAF, ATPase, and Fis domain